MNRSRVAYVSQRPWQLDIGIEEKSFQYCPNNLSPCTSALTTKMFTLGTKKGTVTFFRVL